MFACSAGVVLHMENTSQFATDHSKWRLTYGGTGCSVRACLTYMRARGMGNTNPDTCWNFCCGKLWWCDGLWDHLLKKFTYIATLPFFCLLIMKQMIKSVFMCVKCRNIKSQHIGGLLFLRKIKSTICSSLKCSAFEANTCIPKIRLKLASRLTLRALPWTEKNC